jgi:Ras family
VGTHGDLDSEREVSVAAAQEWAQARGIPYEEVSSRTGRNVREFFEKVVASAAAKSRSTKVLTFLLFLKWTHY